MELAAVVVVALGPWLALTVIVRAAIAAEVVLGPARVLRREAEEAAAPPGLSMPTTSLVPPLAMPPAPARARARRSASEDATDLGE